jgi:hypothetical protein
MRLLAAVPSHAGTIILEGVQTLLAAQRIALRRGGTFRLSYRSGATISLVRNAIVADFLGSEADTLLMLDSDQAVDGPTLERMIDLGKPIVGCIYPGRSYDWRRVRLSGTTDSKHIPLQALKFVGQVETDDQGHFSVHNGFARARVLGTGVMVIRREVFERLQTRFPDLQGRGFGPDAYPNLGHNWGFFNPLDDAEGVPLSEDISFCKRWLQAGGELWADVVGPVVHVGRQPFEGAYLDHLEAIQADDS